MGVNNMIEYKRISITKLDDTHYQVMLIVYNSLESAIKAIDEVYEALKEAVFLWSDGY